MNIDSFIIINKSNYLFFSHSSLKSQLHSLAESSINLPSEFHSGAAIPPKKLSVSLALCIITRVGPQKYINKKKQMPLLSQS